MAAAGEAPATKLWALSKVGAASLIPHPIYCVSI